MSLYASFNGTLGTTIDEIESILTHTTWRYRGPHEIRAVGKSALLRGVTDSQQSKTASSIRALAKAAQDLAQAANQSTQLINDAIGGHVLIRREPGGTNEILIMDNPDPELATKIWRWNLGGLGYSDNVTGADNPAREYDVAMTMDGAINADFITTGKLIADVVQIGPDTTFEEGYDPFQTNQALKSMADGTYSGGTFIDGKSIYTPEVYAGRMHGLRGTFHDLLAGNPEGSRIEMGEKLIAAQAKVSRPEYAIASGFEPGHEPSKAFDGDTGTYWERNVGDFVWIGQEFPEPVCVKAVRRYCASGPLGDDALLFRLIYYDESAGTWRNLDYLHSLYGEGWSQQNVNPGNVYAEKWACSINTIVSHYYVYELEFYDERFSPFVDGYATKTQKAFELNAAGIGTFDGFFFMDGYPAGVIIEQGSNSNGSYVRWSNGLQACWGSNTFPGTGWTGSGDKWYLTGQSLTFPATFDSAPGFFGTTQDASIAMRSAKLANFNTGTSGVANIAFNGWGTTSGSFYLHWLAIGWWK